MMRKTIVTATLLALTAMVSAQEVADAKTASATSSGAGTVGVRTYHFGFLSYNNVLKSMPEYQIAQKALEDLRQKYDEEMTRAEQEFSKKYSEYIDGQNSFPENIMLKRQKELQQLMDQSIAFKDEAKQVIAKAESDIMAPLYSALNDAIRKVGIENGFSYILNTDNNTYPFINTSIGEGKDITEMVKAVLK